MKLPWVLWKAREFEAPNRRRFLQWAWALFLPKPPIDVWSILEWVDGWKVQEVFYWAIQKLPVRFFEYEVWEKWDIWKLVWFPDNHRPIIKEKIQRELAWYIPDLQKLLWSNSELLDFFDSEGSYLQPEVSSYEANRDAWNIDWEFDFLDMVLNFRIPWASNEEEYYLEINICPCEDWVNEPLNIWDAWVILWRIDNKTWRLTDEYEISLMDDEEIFKVLQKPIRDLIPDFKRNSWHKNHEDERMKQEKKETKENSQLPVQISEFSDLMNQILAWEIEITDEVKQKVWVLLSS